MNSLRLIALQARYLASRGRRRRELAERSDRNEAPISVLFYHRVADTFPNAWTINRKGFRQHLDYFQSQFEIISLHEAHRRLSLGISPRPAVAITFDDGYAENLDYALPLLIEREIPATYFVATRPIETGGPFEHDHRNGQPLKVHSIDEIRRIAKSGIEIGGHTANHVDFDRVTTQAEMDDEVIHSKGALEAMIDRPIRFFSVPTGLLPQMRPAVFEASKRAGYDAICSAYGAYNLIGQNPFHIKRIHGDPGFIRLRNWLTFDARKVANEPALWNTDVLTEDNVLPDEVPSQTPRSATQRSTNQPPTNQPTGPSRGEEILA